MEGSYLDCVAQDVKQYLEENSNVLDQYRDDREELEEYLNDTLWAEDSVTGNASGSYTFNSAQAKENVIAHIDDLIKMCEEFGVDASTIGEHFLQEDWEWMDVSIRCYHLNTAINNVLDGIFANQK